MATMEELIQTEMAGTVLPTMKGLIDPARTPTGAQLHPGLTSEQQQAQQMLQGGMGAYLPFMTGGAKQHQLRCKQQAQEQHKLI